MSSAVVAAPVPAPQRTLSLAGRRYPVALPKLRDSRLHVASVTISLHVLGQVGLHFQISVPQILSAILTCAVIDAVLTFRSSRTIAWPASAMLTGSGVALILRVPSTPVGDHWTFHHWWLFSGVAAFSLATKHLVRYRGQPLFNPSNVGLVLTFIVLGSSRVEPLDFWWSPLNGWMLAAYALILGGGSLIARRLHLLAGAAAFWAVLAAGTALVAATGHCMTARWAFAPVCGADYWRAIVTSPEVLIFTFFMITDPRTVPRGRVGHVVFCSFVGAACVLLMAPQSTEYWTKVALLGGLTVLCLLRPLLERALPAAGSEGDTWTAFARQPAFVGAGLVLVVGGMVATGLPSGPAPLLDAENALGRVPHQVDPATLPTITVEQGVLDWNHSISGDGATAVVLALVEDLELENQALLRRDGALLEAIDHGDRLVELQARLAAAAAGAETVIHRYDIDDVRVTLLVPFGRQDGLSLGLVSTGTETVETHDAAGEVTATSSAPFTTTFAVRRALGDRWMIVGTPEA